MYRYIRPYWEDASPYYCPYCYYRWMYESYDPHQFFYPHYIERDQCISVCPQKFASGGYCGKQCTLTSGHYGPHICPDGHQWF